MKNMNRKISLALVLSMIFALIMGVSAPIVSYASDETVYINNAEDLIAFAKKCSYDAWSKGKTVVLTEDISLEDVAFEPIPSFSGIFDGGEHTISGLEVTGYFAPAGLFATLTEGGEIYDGEKYTVTGETTLYAVYDLIEHEITYAYGENKYAAGS